MGIKKRFDRWSRKEFMDACVGMARDIDNDPDVPDGFKWTVRTALSAIALKYKKRLGYTKTKWIVFNLCGHYPSVSEYNTVFDNVLKLIGDNDASTCSRNAS